MKRGREYHGCGEEYNRERVGNITFPLIHIKAVGKNIKLGRGRKFWKQIKIFKKNQGGEEYQIVGNFLFLFCFRGLGLGQFLFRLRNQKSLLQEVERISS